VRTGLLLADRLNHHRTFAFPILNNATAVDACSSAGASFLAAQFLPLKEVAMRSLMTVLVCVVLFSAGTDPDRAPLPTVTADTVTIREVRRGWEIGALAALGDSRDALLVERPVGAREGTKSSVFIVDVNGEQVRRVAVEYGRALPPLIQIVSGLSAGDRIIVSEMWAWDAFEALRLSSR
jgi:hypothetical protein